MRLLHLYPSGSLRSGPRRIPTPQVLRCSRYRFPSSTSRQFSTGNAEKELVSSLPLVRYLRSCTPTSSPPTNKPIYTEFHPYNTMHPAAQSTHLVKTALVESGRLAVSPIFFLKSQSQSQPQPKNQSQSQSQSTQIIATTYLSTHITGHSGFVNGGLSTLLLDDVFARLAAEIFSSRIGMTVKLGMEFLAPGLPNRVYVFRASLDEHRSGGRKAWLDGEMRCLGDFQAGDMGKREIAGGDGVSREEEEGVLVARAEGLFVEPRDVRGMVPLYPQ